jgi:hypothetical protein
MDHQKSNTKKYKSISTGEPCSAAQYVAEMLCMRKRERENVGSLEFKFWNKSYRDEYQVQIRVANKVIKKYGEEALLHYLKSPANKRIYSLGFLHSSKKFVLITKWIEEGIKKSAAIIAEEKKKVKTVVNTDNLVYKPRKSFGSKNSLVNRLRKADDGKKQN